MCGIAGWVDHARDLTRERHVVQTMTNTMKNRGPNDEGVWLSPRGPSATADSPSSISRGADSR